MMTGIQSELFRWTQLAAVDRMRSTLFDASVSPLLAARGLTVYPADGSTARL